MRGYAPSSRDLRRERMVGNWGGASEHIGRRWEEMGLQILQARVNSDSPWPADGYKPRQLVPLAGDESLQLALSRSGLPSPDVIVLLENHNREQMLQALDFKWNLEFASYSQIRAEALTALLGRGITLLDFLLTASLGQNVQGLPVRDGLLAAPDLPVNHWFLSSEQNLRQEYPIEAKEVIFEKVDPLEFFSPLPGWELANLLARADRSATRLRTLEGAEHYFRIGAGLLGAVAQFQSSIFQRQPSPVSAQQAFDWFRARVRPPLSMNFLRSAEKLMATRNQLLARLRSLTRSPYRYSDLVDNLKRRGEPIPEKEDGLPSNDRERWGEILRKVAAEHKELIYRTGLRLVQSGLSDAEALSRMEGDYRRFSIIARNHAEKLINAAFQ
ncbi:MAG: hypothetical protein ACOX87_04105 [Chloroflexota bacterium]|jgi:hypothetical protein